MKLAFVLNGLCVFFLLELFDLFEQISVAPLQHIHFPAFTSLFLRFGQLFAHVIDLRVLIADDFLQVFECLLLLMALASALVEVICQRGGLEFTMRQLHLQLVNALLLGIRSCLCFIERGLQLIFL